MNQMNGIMIAGTKSGVGKTTVSMGLMAALSKRMTVQPYKVGPDYIDPAFHSYITGRGCRNLDSYMLSEEMIQYFYEKNMAGADMSLVEGVMGLFDGAEVGSDIGTSASIAKMLGLPVILVVDGSKVATSLAATVKGFDLFDPDLRMAGVIINNVGSKVHYDILKRGIDYHTEVKVCGYLLKNSALSLPERHLGLVPAGELDELNDVFDQLAQQIEATVDIEAIIELSHTGKQARQEAIKRPIEWPQLRSTGHKIRIAIAKDQAFNFYYQDALDLMAEEYGVEWLPFSPIEDERLPEDIHGLYLGGGFPEMFALELSSNKTLIQSLHEHLEAGLPYVAECGGLMYLCEDLIDLEGVKHPMAGWLKGMTQMERRLQRFGYAQLTLKADCLFGSKGDSIKVHEFHRSSANVEAKALYDLKKIRYGEVIKSWECGFTKGNGIAAYAHMHFASNPEFARNFAQACYDYKIEKKGTL